jgi:hypothetical protein
MSPRETVERALVRSQLYYIEDGEDLLLRNVGALFRSAGRQPLDVRLKIRPRALEFSAVLVSDPSEDQWAEAFWCDWRHLAEATYLGVVHDAEKRECLGIRARVPLLRGRLGRGRALAALLYETLEAMVEGQRKYLAGAWSGPAPK